MGYSSGKVTAPMCASKTAWPENTLLGSSGHNEAVKEVEEVPADLACSLKSVFDGVWTKGFIAGDSLTWADGTISFIRVDEVKRVLEVNFKGTLLTGGLYGEGDRIHWSDGEIWDRCEVDAGKTPKLSDDALLTRMEGHWAEMALGNSPAFVEIQFADGPESTDQVAHKSQANKYGGVFQFAGAPLPSMPDLAAIVFSFATAIYTALLRSVAFFTSRASVLVSIHMCNFCMYVLYGTNGRPVASRPRGGRAITRKDERRRRCSVQASPEHTSHSQPAATITGPGERMFAVDSRKASPIEGETELLPSRVLCK